MFFVKLGYGLGVTVIGLVVVFFALAILIALIMGMTKFFDKSKKPAPAPVKPAAPAPAQATLEDIERQAIMAALSCVYEGTGKRPVVRAVRRSSSDWKRAYR